VLFSTTNLLDRKTTVLTESKMCCTASNFAGKKKFLYSNTYVLNSNKTVLDSKTIVLYSTKTVLDSTTFVLDNKTTVLYSTTSVLASKTTVLYSNSTFLYSTKILLDTKKLCFKEPHCAVQYHNCAG
jgi:hypothetical protein